MDADGDVKVMVVDDHPVFAEALALAIDATDRLTCVGVAQLEADALRLVDQAAPDVAVVDVLLDGADGLALTRMLRARHAPPRVLVLTGQAPSAPLVRAACEAGASALLPKATSLGVVVSTIPSLTDDCFTVDRKTVALVCAPAVAGHAVVGRRSGGTLTGRERDILSLLVSGVDLQTAAVRLGITVNTARGYVKNLYRKLGVHNQLELLAVARERGLLDPSA